MHAATSPSTVQASPSSTPHPVSFPNGSTSHVRASDTPKARARLACHCCRRSKVRCGDSTGEIVRPCPQCIKGNKTCTWPDDTTPTAHPVSKRIEPAAFQEPSPDHRQSESRKRRRPPVSSFERLSVADGDYFTPDRITDPMWDELYDIFKHHYATELPFLHGPTFLKDLKRTDREKLSVHFDVLRLAFLALTVPFHEGIDRQLAQDSLRIARRYAEDAEARIFSPKLPALSSPSIEIPQALLMLSLRAHGQAQGSKAFTMLTNAVGTMQLLGCQFDPELVDRDVDDKKRSTTNQEPRDDSLNGRRFIMEEIRRRTFWGCFIVDRYISSGDYKPRRISLEDPLVLVQLPCKEDNFDLGVKTKTMKLRESDQDFQARRAKYDKEKHPSVEWENETAQSPLVWFIKALDIFGDVMRYTCTVTRRADKEYPFRASVKEMSFYQLDRQRVDKLISSLPIGLKLTPETTEVHIHHRRATPYVLLHSTLLMCKMALHREYLPTTPEPKSYPRGPTDGPNWEALQKACEREEPNFFKDSARTFFKATRDVFDLFMACKEQGALVESPLTTFVCYTVTFNIMWLAFFPNFDQDGVLCQEEDRLDALVVDSYEHAFAILRHLQDRVILSRSFSKRLRMFVRIFMQVKSQHDNPNSPTEVKVSHGLKKYLEVEHLHKEFGDTVPEAEPETAAFQDLPDLRCLLHIYNAEEKPTDNYPSPNGTKSEVKNEHGTNVERAPDSRSVPTGEPTFTPVNQCSSASNYTPSTSNHTPSPGPQYQTNNYHNPYQPTNPSPSFRAPLESPHPFAPPTASYSYKQPITPGTGEHLPNHSEHVAPRSDYYTPPGVDYSNAIWTPDQLNHMIMMRQDIQQFTGPSYIPDSGDYYAPQQPWSQTYYGDS